MWIEGVSHLGVIDDARSALMQIFPRCPSVHERQSGRWVDPSNLRKLRVLEIACPGRCHQIFADLVSQLPMLTIVRVTQDFVDLKIISELFHLLRALRRLDHVGIEVVLPPDMSREHHLAGLIQVDLTTTRNGKLLVNSTYRTLHDMLQNCISQT